MEQYQKKPGSYRSLKAYQKSECVYGIPLFQKHNDSIWYRRQIDNRTDEDIANIAIIVIHQTLALLRGLIDRIDRQFLQEGGIKEQP